MPSLSRARCTRQTSAAQMACLSLILFTLLIPSAIATDDDEVRLMAGENHHLHEMAFENFEFDEFTDVPVTFYITNHNDYRRIEVNLMAKIEPPNSDSLWDSEDISISPETVFVNAGQTLAISAKLYDIPDGQWEVTICSEEYPNDGDGMHDDCVWVNEPITIINKFNWGGFWCGAQCFGILIAVLGLSLLVNGVKKPELG